MINSFISFLVGVVIAFAIAMSGDYVFYPRWYVVPTGSRDGYFRGETPQFRSCYEPRHFFTDDGGGCGSPQSLEAATWLAMSKGGYEVKP